MSEPKIKLGHFKELSRDHVKIKNPEVVLEKLNKLISDGRDHLQIIADYDRTLTKYHVNGEPTLSSFCVFEQKCPNLPVAFVQKSEMLMKKYHPIEINPNLSIEEKIPYMEKWWEENNSMLRGLELEPRLLDIAVIEANVPFRDGCAEALLRLFECNVPVLVFSAGFGNIVLKTLKLEKMYHPNMHIISNFVEFDGTTCLGFQGSTIHIYNKNTHAIQNTNYFKDLTERENVILLGDSLGDVSMSDGIPHGTILKIGFLNTMIEESLPEYMKNFDIVLTDDQTMDVLNGILRHLL